MEEKRVWQVEKMLAELPPTPVPEAVEVMAQPLPNLGAPKVRSPRRSPRKSSHKSVAVARGAKKARVSRRSSGLGAAAASKGKVIPSFETEVLPPSPSFQPPHFKTSMEPPQPQPPALPSVFMIPPPSPAAKLPSQQSADTLSQHLPPMSSLTSIDTLNDARASSSNGPDVALSIQVAVLDTPGGHKPFPMAKPLAARMIHAYSPVKPSPLSRIMMLANSPDSPQSDDGETSPSPGVPLVAPPLGKIPAVNFNISDERLPSQDDGAAQGKHRDTQKPKTQSSTAVRMIALEKENKRRVKSSVHAASSSRQASQKESRKAIPPSSSNQAMTSSRTKPAMKLPPGKGGARRVPINSADAAPTAPGWRG